jgi:hypothetical protein
MSVTDLTSQSKDRYAEDSVTITGNELRRFDKDQWGISVQVSFTSDQERDALS